MKTKTFTKSNGDAGESYHPELPDKYEILESKISTFSHPAIVQGKAVNIDTHTIKVKTADGKDIFLTITEGMKKAIERNEDIKGKELSFENYEHATYGTLLGARVA